MKAMRVVFVLFFMTFGILSAQQENMEMNAEMKAWMEYAKPGEMHKLLESRVGTWKSHMEMWMQPGAEAMVSEGTAKYEMILGGRYLKGTFTGSSMGMPFEGFSIDAFDNTTEEFITTWMDTFGTGITVAYGKYEKEKNTITSMGKMVDPVSGKYTKYKTVSWEENKDKAVFDMYMIMPDGSEFHSMRMTYERVK